MTEIDPAAFSSDEELEASIRPLVNEILDRFNQEGVSPSQAGLVILSLVYRLMEVMNDAPEARRFFILTLINLINNYLAEEMENAGEVAAPGMEEGA
jgi:fructosamine-3-kinase